MFKDELKLYIEKNFLHQQDFADHIGYSVSTVSMVVNGAYLPSAKFRNKLPDRLRKLALKEKLQEMKNGV